VALLFRCNAKPGLGPCWDFSRYHAFQRTTQFLGKLSAQSLPDAAAGHGREFRGEHRGQSDRCFCRIYHHDPLERHARRWSCRKTGLLRGSRRFIWDTCRTGWQFLVARAEGSSTPRLSLARTVPVVLPRDEITRRRYGN